MTHVCSKIFLYNLIFAIVLIVLCMARPQNAIDSQDGPEYQPNVIDASNYYPYPSQGMLENVPLNQLQYFIKQLKPSSSGSNWETLYRAPETKRQMRYRQCYFNPISCFKK